MSQTLGSPNTAEILHTLQPGSNEGSPNVMFSRYLRSKLALGEYHPIVARHLNNLAIILMRLGQYDKAQKMLQKAISDMETRLPPRLPEYLCALCSLATSYYVVGQKVDGDALLTKCCVYEDAFHEPALQKNLDAARLASRTGENTLVFMDISVVPYSDAAIGRTQDLSTKEPLSPSKRAIYLPKFLSRSRLKGEMTHPLGTQKGRGLITREKHGTWRCPLSSKKAMSENSSSKDEADISEEAKAMEAWSVVVKLCEDVARDSFPHDELMRNTIPPASTGSIISGQRPERVVPNRGRTIRWLLGSHNEEIHELDAISRTLAELPTPFNFNLGEELPANSGHSASDTSSEIVQENEHSSPSPCDTVKSTESGRNSVASNPHSSDKCEKPALDWTPPTLPRLQIPVRFSFAREATISTDPTSSSLVENGGSFVYVSPSSDTSTGEPSTPDEPSTPAEPPVIVIDLPDTNLDTFFSDCGMVATSENPTRGQPERYDKYNGRVRSIRLRPELFPLPREIKKLDVGSETGESLQLHPNPIESFSQPSHAQEEILSPSESNTRPFGLRHFIKMGRETLNDRDEHMSDICTSSLRTDRSSGLYPDRILVADIFKRSDQGRPIFLEKVEILLDTGSTDADIVSEDYCEFMGLDIHPLTKEHLRHYIGAGGSPVDVVGISKIGVRWSGRHGTISKVREFVVVKDHPQDLSFGNKTISRYNLLNAALMMPLILASRSKKTREEDWRQTQMIQEATKREEARKIEERLRLWDLNWEASSASRGQGQTFPDTDPASSSDVSSQTGIGSRSTWGSSEGSSHSTLPSSNTSPIEPTKRFI